MRWWLACALLTACGAPHVAMNDGGDEGRGSIFVHIFDPAGTGSPVVGASVFVADPDGTVHETLTSDANGDAVGDLLPGGSLTVLSLDQQMFTVLSAMPGDHIVIGPDAKPNTVALGSMQVEFPSYAGATYYRAYTPCGMQDDIAGSPVSMALQAPCTTVSVLVAAIDDHDQVLATTWSGSQAFVDGGTVSLTGGWAPVGQFTVNMIDLPSGLRGVKATRQVPAIGEGITATADTQMTPPPTLILQPELVAGPSSIVSVDLGPSRTSFQQITEAVPADSGVMQLDGATDLLPWLTPTFDPAVDMLSVGASAGRTPAIVQTRLSWNTALGQHDWMIYSSTTGVQPLPKLLPAYLPPLGAHGIVYADAVASDAWPDYATARSRPELAIQSGWGAPDSGSRWQVSQAQAGF